MSDTYIIFKCDNKASNIIFAVISKDDTNQLIKECRYKLRVSKDWGCFDDICEKSGRVDLFVHNIDKSSIFNIYKIKKGFLNKKGKWHDEIYIKSYGNINIYQKENGYTDKIFNIFSEQVKYNLCSDNIISVMDSEYETIYPDLIMCNEIDLRDYNEVRLNKDKIPSFLYKVSYILSGRLPKKGVYGYGTGEKYNYSDTSWNEFYDFDEEKDKTYDFYDTHDLNFKILYANKKYDCKIYFKNKLL
jgi:hypothetical protein